ncbi:MAG: HD domain-containing protein [Candidatus Andersenbacteria bacterium]
MFDIVNAMKSMEILLRAAGKLKTVIRSGWIRKNIKDPESVAEHSYRTALTAYLLADEGVDREKVLLMGLIHDLAEAEVGDITLHDGISPEEKETQERLAFEKLAQAAGRDDLLKLWHEYEAQNTPEALLVKDADMIEVIMQALEYEEAQGADLQEFWNNVRPNLKSPKAREFFAHLERQRMGPL